MRRVLVVSYDFPPCRAQGAAVRTASFVRHMGAFGWRATVLTRAEPGTRPAEASAFTLRVPSHEISLSYQLTAWLWAAVARHHARRLLQRRDFDLLYVSCPPFPLGLVGASLARTRQIPLVVDFRDAWSLDPYEPAWRLKRRAKRLLCRHVWPRAEARVLRASARVLVVTPSMKSAYARAYPGSSGRLQLLPNGFDEGEHALEREDPSPTTRFSPRDTLELLYTGRFTGVADRYPASLLSALRTLNDEGRTIRLRILGDVSHRVAALVARSGTEDVVRLEAPVSHAAAVDSLRECDALVLYQEPARGEVSAVAGKTYEYLRSGKPILAVTPPGDNAELVTRHAAYSVLCSPRCAESVTAGLRRLHTDWRAGELPRHTPPAPEFLERFDRRILTKRLVEVFDEVVAAEARSP